MPRYDDLSKDELIRLLEARDLRDTTRFGLVWEANEIERDRALNKDFIALDLDPSLSCGTAPWRNLIIEGDNYDALRHLRLAFSGRVKCILIDPPYNTGKKDFVYNDRFVDENDSWRFSTWIEFLHQRLIIARDLLREDGVLLCCINDDNRSKLELLLDKVMPGMRIGSMVWRTRDSTSAKSRNFSDTHEHILIYGRPGFSFRGRGKSQKKYKNPDNDPRGPWNIDPLTLGFDRIHRKNLYYPIRNPETDRWYPCDPNLVWRYASELNPETKLDTLETESMEEWIRQKKIVFPNPSDERYEVWNTLEELRAAIESGDVPVTPKKKNPLLTKDTPDLEFWVGKQIGFGRPGFKKHWKDLRSHINPVGSWIARLNEDYEEEDFISLRSREAGEGTGVIEKIFGKKVFSYPKPPSLMQQLVAQSSESDDIIMDFFSGSGTTAHAVLQQNAEDGERRRFIMVSNAEATIDEPDKNICRDVCSTRIKAAIEGFGVNEGTGGDFAYLRTRRISPGTLLQIDHAQVWTALQLIHRETLMPYVESPYLWAGDEETALLYVPRADDEFTPELRTRIAESASVICYSWQPELLRQRLRSGHVQHEPIPESLARRFGLKL
ncbi:MAG: site-specific DNA-methyltransferase [Verrucomicrobiota bacterium]|nr:site-specific DNA-methyltransferase [Verrucomicrobiota bacterium]